MVSSVCRSSLEYRRGSRPDEARADALLREGVSASSLTGSVSDTTPEPPDPEDRENAWRDYDADASGCIEPGEFQETTYNYATGKISYLLLVSVIRNRC